MRIRKFLHSHFNPRSYKRSDLSIMAFTVFTHLFQSTLLQEERLLFSVMIPLINCISIHAPTRGATPLSGKLRFVYIISIHAPTRGATIFLVFFEPKSEFQSTLLQEERHYDSSLFDNLRFISIHAPTRGATQLHVRLSLKWSISIHAPTRGATAEMR